MTRRDKTIMFAGMNIGFWSALWLMFVGFSWVF